MIPFYKWRLVFILESESSGLSGHPTTPIFHLLALVVGVEGNANFSFGVGVTQILALALGVTQILANFSVFRYQHVGIPNTKLWRWGSKPM